LEDLCIGGRIIIVWNLNKYGMRVWRGLIWIRIGMNGRVL
jgi:hypothetical protein